MCHFRAREGMTPSHIAGAALAPCAPLTLFKVISFRADAWPACRMASAHAYVFYTCLCFKMCTHLQVNFSYSGVIYTHLYYFISIVLTCVSML